MMSVNVSFFCSNAVAQLLATGIVLGSISLNLFACLSRRTPNALFFRWWKYSSFIKWCCHSKDLVKTVNQLNCLWAWSTYLSNRSKEKWKKRAINHNYFKFINSWLQSSANRDFELLWLYYLSFSVKTRQVLCTPSENTGYCLLLRWSGEKSWNLRISHEY